MIFAADVCRRHPTLMRWGTKKECSLGWVCGSSCRLRHAYPFTRLSARPLQQAEGRSAYQGRGEERRGIAQQATLVDLSRRDGLFLALGTPRRPRGRSDAGGVCWQMCTKPVHRPHAGAQRH